MKKNRDTTVFRYPALVLLALLLFWVMGAYKRLVRMRAAVG